MKNLNRKNNIYKNKNEGKEKRITDNRPESQIHEFRIKKRKDIEIGKYRGNGLPQHDRRRNGYPDGP